MCGHALGQHVIALGGLEVGMPQQVGGDRDLVRSGINQLGHSAMRKQVGLDGFTEGFLGVSLDLPPDRPAAHRLPPAVEPEASARDSALGQCN
jgi:hypothetical protein